MSGTNGNSHTPVTLEDCWRISGPFFHGTGASLRGGDELVAGRVTNFHPGRVMNVCFTALLETAVWAAELAVALGGQERTDGGGRGTGVRLATEPHPR